MARAYFYVVDQGPNWTIRYERRNYGMFASEAAGYSQATQWARDQGKEGHDAQVFTRAGDGKYRARWSFARDPYPAEALHPVAQERVATASIAGILVVVLAIALGASSAAAEDLASGTVQICRQPGIVDVYTGKPIAIPPGATFVDNGVPAGPPGSGDASRLRIATLEASQIAANAFCTVARARVSQSVAGVVARAADGRRLAPSRMASGDPGWPGNLYLIATVASDFR